MGFGQCSDCDHPLSIVEFGWAPRTKGRCLDCIIDALGKAEIDRDVRVAQRKAQLEMVYEGHTSDERGNLSNPEPMTVSELTKILASALCEAVVKIDGKHVNEAWIEPDGGTVHITSRDEE